MDAISRDAISQAYEQILQRFVDWALGQADIRAALVIGSRARQLDHPADEFADLDLILFCTDTQTYLSQAGWIEAMGEPWLTFVEATGDGSQLERRVLYDGGLDVDFALVPMGVVQESAEQGLPPAFIDIVQRGVRLLVDKDNLFTDLPAMSGLRQPQTPPTQAEFLQAVNDFWYHAVWSAKHLRRGELWWAKGCIDVHLKYLLQRMLEWHAQAMHGPGYDTWLRGRFLEEWADPRALAELRQCFGHYDSDNLWLALFATMRLFRWLMEGTAQKLNIAYAQSGIDAAAMLVHKLYDEKLASNF